MGMWDLALPIHLDFDLAEADDAEQGAGTAATVDIETCFALLNGKWISVLSDGRTARADQSFRARNTRRCFQLHGAMDVVMVADSGLLYRSYLARGKCKRASGAGMASKQSSRRSGQRWGKGPDKPKKKPASRQ